MSSIRSVLIFAMLSVTIVNVNAQLCQGSLGDPIVNITFGAGANPGASLAAATTTYQYVSTDCPNDGFYTVRTNTVSCFASTWHTLNSDHTGNPNGYFMLVNASVQPSAFYIDTVRGLCNNTTFEFAAWVVNVLKPTACGGNGNKPNLTFSIEKTDGTILQTYNTGDIASQVNPAWQQFGFFFTTPVGIYDVVLRIFNNAPGGCGNDLALDDITFRPCGPQISAAILGSSVTTVDYCEGVAKSFTFTSSVASGGFVNPSYQWQQNINGIGWTDIPGETNATFTKNFPVNALPGTYLYRLSAAEAGNMSSLLCRVASPTLTININPIPVTTANSNTPVCEGHDLILTATGGAQYQWSGVNGFSGSGSPLTIPNAQLSMSGKYYVLVSSAAGCNNLDSASVVVNPTPVATTTFDNASICKGSSLQLAANGGTVYQWIPANGLSSAIIPDPVASPADTTQYMVIVSNQFACSDTAQVLLNVAELPYANAGPDKIIITGSSVQLSGTVSGQDITYSWSPDLDINNTAVLNPTVTPPADIDYFLTATSNVGCGVATDAVHVFVYKDVFIPGGFTPNNDGLNDTWRIPALSAFVNYEVSVYNRYGELVFYTKNINKGWDGKYKGVEQGPGVFVYMIDLKDEKRFFKGTFTLIR